MGNLYCEQMSHASIQASGMLLQCETHLQGDDGLCIRQLAHDGLQLVAIRLLQALGRSLLAASTKSQGQTLGFDAGF